MPSFSRSRALAVLPVLLLLASCGDEPAPQADQAAPPPQTERERLINNTQAASAVGYDGQGVKRVVENMVKTSDAQQAQLEEAAQAAGQAEPDAAK
jgi:hypothetical protein